MRSECRARVLAERDDQWLAELVLSADALGPLGLPLVGGVECGHVAPRMPMVNGALATAEWSPGRGVLTQRFV